MLAASSQNTAWRNAGASDGSRALDVEHAQRHAELGRDGPLARGAGKAGVAAIELEPPGMAQVSLGTRLRHQRLVLAHRAGEQRPHRPHGLDEVLRRGIAAEREQPGSDLREKADVVVGFRRALERNADERGETRGKARREQRVALDDAGVAIRRALPRLAAVHQRDGKSALGEVEGHRDTDDTGAEHDRVGASHETFPVRSAGGRLGGKRRAADI